MRTPHRHTYDLHSERFFADPESTFGKMRDRDPVYFDSTLSAWVLTRYDDVSEALRDARLSVDRNGEIGRGSSAAVAPELRRINAIISQWMVFSDPPRHTRLRGLVAPAFQRHALQHLVPAIDRIVDDLLDRAEQRGTLEVKRELGVPVAERVTAHLLGLPEDTPDRLKRWTEDLFGFIGASQASDAIVRSNAEGINALCAFIASVVAARRNAPGNDLVSRMLEDAAGDFTEEELVGVVITLIAGAYETTAHSITNGLFLLVRHPEQLRLLRRRPDLISGAVEETLRMDGPALSVQRRAKRDLVIRETPIRSGDRIYCMLHSANHDPAVFSRPHELRIARSPCRHLGLGLGPHFCLGAWLTRLETQRALLKTVQRFGNLRLAGDAEPQWVANFAIRGLEELTLMTSVAPSASLDTQASH